VAGLSGAGGFLLGAALLASIHAKIELEPLPAALRGVPAALITLAIMSLAFLGFRGIGG
jgi:electron transport complex protein RnfA